MKIPRLGIELELLEDRNSLCVCVFRATPVAHGSSQARGPIGAAAAGLYHNHSNLGSELRLQPTPQLTTMLDP